MRILLVEDDPASVQILNRYLSDQNYAVDVVSDGETGWNYASTYDYDLLILDIVLPRLDGISLCQRLRVDGYTTPIMLLTAQDSSTTKILGLDAGADDYVVKPFDPAEWNARIRALLRRGSTNSLPVLTWGHLWLNSTTSEVTYDGQPIILSAKEYALLELLMRESQHVFSNEEIVESLWSSDEFPAESTVRSHMRRLRHKLVEAGAPSDLIATAHGRGYYLRPSLSSTTPELESDQVDDTRTGLQEQYQDMLGRVWSETLPQIHQHIHTIKHALERLEQGQLSANDQKAASHAAHALAGTLGTLGQLGCMKHAQNLEQEFCLELVLTSGDVPYLQRLVKALTDAVATVPSSRLSAIALPGSQAVLGVGSPELWLVDPETQLELTLQPAAYQAGFQLRTLSSYLDALAALSQKPHHSQDLAGLIISLTPVASPISTHFASALSVLDTFSHQYPMLPSLVIAENLSWNDRLAIVRRGGKCILPRSVSPQRLLEPIRKLYNAVQERRGKRVMLVDDDPMLLRLLPDQLQSFGLEVSTLNDPEQFWNFLDVTRPDVLVLDIKMPMVNGLELCRALRSDPTWQQLPILFLSVVTDAQTQTEAFAAGADDYLFKPVTGTDLAYRIFNRLQRMQAWRSAS